VYNSSIEMGCGNMYVPLKLEQTISIRKLYSLHYFQFAAGYIFSGERHNFWEIVYIDHGEADIGAGKKVYRLSQGMMIFHKPDEFHSIWAESTSGANIVVISFDTSSRAMRYFRNRQFVLDSAQRKLISQIISEAQLCFGSVLDISTLTKLIPLENAPVGSQQIIGLYLMQLLIMLLRKQNAVTKPRTVKGSRLTQEQAAQDVISGVMKQMRSFPDGCLTFEQMCKSSGMCATALKECFRKYNNTGVMECYRFIRLQEARRLLREGRLNITQVSEKLGYSSVYYFSIQFKRVIGISPSEYIKSVRE
jgi:AraC-like DNA-binding protein